MVGLKIGLLWNPRLEIVSIDERIEASDMVGVTVRENQVFRIHPDLVDPIDDGIHSVRESSIYECRGAINKEEYAISFLTFLCTGDIVYLLGNFLWHMHISRKDGKKGATAPRG